MKRYSHKSLSGVILGGLYQESAVWQQGSRSIDLHTAKNMIAAAQKAFHNAGLKKGDTVAVHGTPTPESLATLIAALLDGIVIISIDSGLKDPRKHQMLALAKPAALVNFQADTTIESDIPAIEVGEAVADDDDLSWIEDDDTNGPCYIFFTSGTTGTPKPVVGSRNGLAHFIAWERDLLRLIPDDRVSLLTRFSFDVVLRDILLPIASGCCSVIPDTHNPMDANSMRSWIIAHGVTVLHTVPSLAHAMLASSENDAPNKTMKHTLFAGEPLSSVIVSRWRKQFPNTHVHNLYGPTETTLAKFHAWVPDPSPQGIQSCGFGLPGTVVRILSEIGDVVTHGELGEVAISTPYASIGYLDADTGGIMPVITAWKNDAHYCTGDLGYIDETGRLHLKGRKDDQVKIRGVRLELAGIAAQIEAHPAVDKAVVVAETGENGFKKLIAWYTSPPHKSTTAKDIRHFLSQHSLEAGIPELLIERNSFPLTANGKIDKSALEKPAIKGDDTPAETEIEAILIEAFKAQLGHKPVGANSDFFELGGDSLAAIAICSNVSKQLNKQLGLKLFLDAPTPRLLAECLETVDGGLAAPIPAAPVTKYFPLTPQQQRYFRTYCTSGNRNWCNLVKLIDLPDNVTAFQVLHAINDISVHQDGLRLAFELDEEGEVTQHIAPNSVFTLQSLDLTKLPLDKLPEKLNQLKTEESENPIELFSANTLFRATLLLLPKQRRKLLWIAHHLISDGTSQRIFARLINECLKDSQSFRRRFSSNVSFKDVAYYTTPENPEPVAEYFLDMLRTPDVYQHEYFPNKHNIEDQQRSYAFDAALSKDAMLWIRHRAKMMKCTPYIILLSGYLRMLEKLTAKSDIAIVTPLAGREHPETREIIANMINLVSLRIPDMNKLDEAELVLRIMKLVREGARHQNSQFDRVLDALGLPFPDDRNALTGFSFNYEPQGCEGTPVGRQHTDHGYKLKYDMQFLVSDYTNAINLEIQYRAGLFSYAEIERVFDSFESNFN